MSVVNKCAETNAGLPESPDTQVACAEGVILTARDVRKNMVFTILLDAIFATGWAEITLALQPLLVYLKASNMMIGLITGANWAGLLGVFLSPWITRRFKYKKWYMFVVHIPYLAALGIAGLGIVYSRQLNFDNSALTLFLLVAFLAHWGFGGFVSLPHNEFIAACIPMRYRGRYTGFSFSAGGACSILSAIVGGVILLKMAKPVAFGYLFLLAWAVIQFGYIFALFAKELPTPVEKSPQPWSKSMFKAAWSDKPFVKFLLINILATMLIMPVFPFVNIYGFKVLGMVPATAAIIQIITQVVKIGVSILVGIATDKLGPAKVLPYWIFVGAISLLPPVFMQNAYGVYISVALSTMYIVGTGTAFMALVYGLPKPENRAGHYTVQLVLYFAAASIGPILVGRICDVMPYRSVFILSAVVAMALVPLAKYVSGALSSDVKSYS